jgi:dTDP-4-amino-4,6-dideoxygalactose transaminase
MKKKGLTRRQFLETTSAGVVAASALPRRAPAVSGNPNALALNGGTPVRTKPYPTWPQTAEVDEEYIIKSVRSHKWCTLDKGNFIPQFEQAWKERTGAAGCVMTPCGTHALQMALELLDIGPGDEVLVSPYTYIATVDAIMMGYSLPVFVDVDLETFTMDPADIEHRINENTRAILPVHIHGNAANMDEILPIAQKRNLSVVEDACQGQLVEWHGKKLGTLGTIGCFSFQESKIIPGGEAGALVSMDQELIDKAYCFRDFGSDQKGHGGYIMRGFKYRISDFAAAILMAQLTRLDATRAVREKHAAYLTDGLKKNIPGLIPQAGYPPCTRRNYYVFGMRYDAEHFSGMTRKKFVEAMHAEGIPMGGGGSRATVLNKQPFIERSLNSRGFQRNFSAQRLERYRAENNCPNNDKLAETSVRLDQEVLIAGKEDVDDILEAAAKVQKFAATVS